MSPEVETQWVAETDEKEQQVRAEAEDKREGAGWKTERQRQRMTDEESCCGLV